MRPFLHLVFATLLAPLAATAASAQGQQPAPPAPPTDPAIYAISYVEVAPASASQAGKALKQLADASRKEAGVLTFDVARRISPTNQFVIIEAWKDQAAFDAHQAAASAKQATTALASALIAPVDQRVGTHMMGFGLTAEPAGSLIGVSHVDVAPPRRDDGFAMLVKFSEASRKATGNVRSYPMREKTRLNHFTVFEVWKNQAAIDASETSDAAKDFRNSLQGMTGALYDRRWYKAL